MSHLKDLHVLILGLGDSGLAMARWCHAHGAAELRVWDSREAPPQAAALAAEVPLAQLFSGELTEASLGSARWVLKSPGLAPSDARLLPLLEAAKAQGIVVAGELGLFAHALADLKAERRYEPKVIAITGTNGKTTTTALTAMLVERAGKRVAVAGNIGPTLLDTLSAALAAQQVADEAAAAEDAAAAEQANLLLPCHSREGGNPPPDNTWIPASAGMTALDEPAAANEAVDPDSIEVPLPPDDEDAPLVLAPPPEVAPVFEHLPEVWVLELSSFQLDGVQGFEPTAATVLNVTQDHLDWHGSMQAYAAAKARIFGQSTLMVINRDDAMVEAMVPAPVLIHGAPKPAQALAAPRGGEASLGRPGGRPKGGRGKASKMVQRPVRRFGLDAPSHPSDFGLVTENGMAWLVHALPADETVKRRKDEEEEIILQRMMPAEALRIRGRHNASNALAALALAQSVGCPLAPMLHGLREYTGEPHRVELIGQVGGIEAFDDSKGTNVGATVAALNGLGADKLSSKLIVILGGDGKGQDFSPLAAPVAQYVRAFATLGRDAEAIEQALVGTGVPFARHATLEAAVPWCFAQAQPGDAVLLSPACASLDMFRNYAHRAEVFITAVQDLANERGEMLQ